MAFISYHHNHNTFNTSHTVTSFSSALSWLSFPSFPLLDDFLFNSMENMMSKRSRKQPKTSLFESEEVSSSEWEFIDITEPEEDLIYRMHRLIGDRWDLIAGRIPGRKAEEIERFWIMKNNEEYAERRKLINNKKKSKISS